MDLGVAATAVKAPWAKSLPDQMSAVHRTLGDLGVAFPAQVARHFARGRATTVRPLLETLTTMGMARIVEGGRFVA